MPEPPAVGPDRADELTAAMNWLEELASMHIGKEAKAHLRTIIAALAASGAGPTEPSEPGDPCELDLARKELLAALRMWENTPSTVGARYGVVTVHVWALAAVLARTAPREQEPASDRWFTPQPVDAPPREKTPE